MNGLEARLSVKSWLGIVVFFAVILPRAAALGDFPWLDDGYHAFIAQTINSGYRQGTGFPEAISGFKLFESLFFWVWNLPGNALFWLRLADLGFAALAGWLFGLCLIRESGSRIFGLLITFAGLCALNLPGAIQSGFKHSFFPAFACLFGAFYLSGPARKKPSLWFYSGVLTATGVLFRETFFPFALLGAIGLLAGKNWSALWRYCAGGLGGAALITGLVALARGQFGAIFAFYFQYGKIYEPEAGRRWLKFIENGGRAIALFSPLLALFLGALVSIARFGSNGGRGRLCFWLACAVLPLAEPMLKIGFLYHFSVCIPGLCGFCALSWRLCVKNRPHLRKFALACSVCAAIACAALLAPHFAKARTTLAVLRAWPQGGWSKELAARSTTLAAAEVMRELAPGGATVASTGFAYFIFPASGFLPPEPGLGDLSRAFIYSGYDPGKLKLRVDANPPDIVLIMHTDEDHSAVFEKELKSVFDNHPDYRLVRIIYADPDANYGWLGYSIYKRVAKSGD